MWQVLRHTRTGGGDCVYHVLVGKFTAVGECIQRLAI